MARGRLAPAVALTVAVLALAAPAAGQAVPPAPDPYFYGVTSATELEPGEYQRMAAGGIRTLRLAFFWPHIEPDPPQRPPEIPGSPAGLPEDQTRWGPVDEVIERAAGSGIRVLPFVYGSPDWVAPQEMRPPIDDDAAREAWRDFLGDLVRRYGPNGEFWDRLAILEPGVPYLPITEWQIWNEANSPVFFSPRPSPAEYRELVALASEAIRGVDPAATIVLGGMFGAPANGIRAWDFLRRFQAGGAAAGTYDAYALHPYAPALRGIAAQVRRLRRAIAAGPAPTAPLWITEIGWPTKGPADFNLVKSKRGQKRLLARAYRLFLAKESWNIAKLVWYVWRDNNVQPECTVCSYSGLFTKRLEPKPAWRTLTRFTGGTP